MLLSEKRWLVASSNWYATAPRTGFQPNEGVRENVWTTGSSARRTNGCRPVGAVLGRRASAEPTSMRAASNAARERTRAIVSTVVGTGDGRGVPRTSDSVEGEGLFQRFSGRENARVLAGRRGELNGGWEAVLGRAAGEGECGPAGRVEGQRQAGEPVADRDLIRWGPGRDTNQRWRDDQVDLARCFEQLVSVAPALLGRLLVLRLGQREAVLDLRADVRAVRVGVLGEELAVHIGDLPAEGRADSVGEREVEASGVREERRGGFDSLPDERVGVLGPGDAYLELVELDLGRLEAGDEHFHHPGAAVDVQRHRARMVEAG